MCAVCHHHPASDLKIIMSGPLFPSLAPRTVDRTWFSVDKPLDDEVELTKLEEEYQNWHQNLLFRDSNIVPIGKSSEHQDEEEDEEDDDEGDEEDDSDTNDDELDTDMMEDRDSGDDASTY